MARTQIGLDIPERSKPDRASFDIRAKKLEPWIADLPRANLGETARLIYRVLKDSNTLQYSYQERIFFLEKMREPVFYITSTMKKYYVGVNFPLADKNYKVASACREILFALATGYKIAIEDHLANSLLFTDKKLLSKLIHRSLSSLGHVLMTSYQAYEPFPKDIWGDIHKLYAFAENRKLLNTEVSDAHRKHNLYSSIREEYLRLLLVQLASPYKLRQGEISKVFFALERWAKEARLVKLADQSAQSRFAVNLLGNCPPRSLALTTEKCSAETECRIIDTGDLAQVVQEELSNSTDMATTTLPGIEMQRNELSHDLLRRLLLAWGVVPKRLFPRVHKSEKLRITLGLSSTHKVITDGNYSRQGDPAAYNTQTKDKFIHTARFNSSNISNVNETQPDIWDMIYPGAKPQTSPTVEEPDINDTQINLHVGQSYYHIETWAMLNESANGYCLASKATSDTNIQVGELIGVQRSGDGHTWKWGVGVVRWMKQIRDQGLSLGIEMLTPDAAAIGIKSAFSDNDEDYKRTLMLPELPAIKQSKTLITGPVPFRVGNQLEMRILGKKMGISLTRQIRNTGFFAQFEFDVVEQGERNQAEKKQSPDDKEDFDSIWSII